METMINYYVPEDGYDRLAKDKITKELVDRTLDVLMDLQLLFYCY